MSKSDPKATVMVARANGGLLPVRDRRFEPPRDSPILFEVPAGDADLWLRYFYDLCSRRGWSTAGIGQTDRSEDSGSITSTRAVLKDRNWPSSGSAGVNARCRYGRARQASQRCHARRFRPLDKVIARCASRVVDLVYRAADGLRTTGYPGPVDGG
jgi:hypothetical protein